MVKNSKKEVEIIGVPIDLGANLRGACMGPAAIRIAELHTKIKMLDYRVDDIGDLFVPIRETIQPEIASEKYRSIVFNTANELMKIVENALKQNKIPITIGGDHSLAIGSISGVSKYFREQNKKIGLIWVDAHADFNTPKSSPTGNLHGMPLAILSGYGDPDLVNLGGFAPKIPPQCAALIGIRTLDGQEKEICKSSGIKYYTMREIDERGLSHCMKEALSTLLKNCDGIHVSFDLDVIDPHYAPGVSTPATGGISYREAHLLLEMIADTQKLISMDIVELNPMQDINHKTSNLAVELIQSALGKSII